MGRRDLSAGVLLALLGLGGTLVATRTQLPDNNPYVLAVLIVGWLCIVVSAIGLIVLFAAPNKDEGKPRLWSADKRPFKPDMGLDDLVMYVGTGSHWAKMISQTNPTRGANLDQIEAQIVAKLASGQVCGWARSRPNGPERQVDNKAWEGASIHLARGHAFLPVVARNLYSLRVSKAEVEQAWPPR